MLSAPPPDASPAGPSLAGRLYVESLGCAGNRTDGERVQAWFRAHGWERTTDPRQADLLVLQTCGFTAYMEAVCRRRLDELRALKGREARLMVGGCLPAINPSVAAQVPSADLFGPRSLERLAGLLPSTGARLADIPAVATSREEPGVATVRVATGCLDRCAYCAIPFANGRIVSRDAEAVCRDVLEARARGFSSVHLVAEDIGAWGRDRRRTLLDLLDALLALPEGLPLQIDNLNPNWVLEMEEPLLERLQHPRMRRRFYIPLQSGSDEVLARMRRRYRYGDVTRVFRRFREALPGSQFSTDVIVGFPGETVEEFEASRAALRALQPDFASIYKYEDRPRIEAAALTSKVPDEVKEQRVRALLMEMLTIQAAMLGLTSADDLLPRLRRGEPLSLHTNATLLVSSGKDES